MGFHVDASRALQVADYKGCCEVDCGEEWSPLEIPITHCSKRRSKDVIPDDGARPALGLLRE